MLTRLRYGAQRAINDNISNFACSVRVAHEARSAEPSGGQGLGCECMPSARSAAAQQLLGVFFLQPVQAVDSRCLGAVSGLCCVQQPVLFAVAGDAVAALLPASACRFTAANDGCSRSRVPNTVPDGGLDCQSAGRRTS